MSWFTKIADKLEENKDISKITEGIKRTVDEVKGLVGSSKERHEDPEVKREDEIRAEINANHRFQSFADIRYQNFVKWHICGHDYFWALSEILDSAKESIFIMDWWLSPELYLRRPPTFYPQWRLDRLLRRKAQEGVKVYVMVYKEVTQTMTMSSAHTKHALESLHPNIVVMRHPDHIGSEFTTEFWSHHEKVVVVDNLKACIGGLDICFGRWDTTTHPLADAHPTEFSRTLFAGQDYNNARFMDFQAVDHFISNQVSVLEIPRMPWEDVHMTLIGPAVLDITQHFVERWNKIKKEKYSSDTHYDWLALPHDVDAAPNEAVARHPHRERWHQMGVHFRQRWMGDDAPPDDEEGFPPYGNMNVQVVRSVSDWSHGVLIEHSIQNAYIELIKEAQHFIYIENQFFISNTGDFGPVKNRIAQALLEKIIEKAKAGEKFKVVVVIPELPGFAGNVDASAISTILAGQWRTINRGGHSIFEGIQAAGFDPKDYIRFFHLRTYDRINGPLSFIQEMEKNSSVPFFQAQVALSRQWLGNRIDANEDKSVKINVIVPTANTGDKKSLGATEGTKKEEAAKVTEYVLPDSEEEAKAKIAQFESGAPRSDQEVSDTIGQHVQFDRTALNAEKWLGTEQEERDCIVSELVYIHSKVMIVDDRKVIMGSANLNDRSQKGDGDSEIALVVEDQENIPSLMDGRPYQAARFAATLRRKLFRTHLGLVQPQICSSANDPVTNFMRPAPIPNPDEDGPEDSGYQSYGQDRNKSDDERKYDLVKDPLSDESQALWNDTARKNRDAYTAVFQPIPNDIVRNWTMYKSYVPNIKTGHIANPDMPLDRIKERLSEIRGHIVEAPVEFLIEEKGLVTGVTWEGYNPTLPLYI